MSTISKFAGRVVCTKAQFDALAEKDPNKEYLVTDDDTYIVAPSTDGTAGQVLKKTATGTEWANESGGGKLYFHKVNVDAGGVPVFKFKFISTSNTLITKDNIYKSDLSKIAFDMFLSGDSESVVPPVSYIAINFSATPDSVSVFYFKTYPTDHISSIDIGSGGNYSVVDITTEL